MAHAVRIDNFVRIPSCVDRKDRTTTAKTTKAASNLTPMWTIFQIVVLIAAGSIIIFGGEIDGHAISVSAFLGLAALVVWLASSWIFSKMTELVRQTYRRRRELGSLIPFTGVQQYFSGFAKINTLSERVKELHEAMAASGKKD
ncbi:MAG: hypothetical protein WA728_24455 [Xanthobacteraceae bacterium]